jgi:hypothetical protein
MVIAFYFRWTMHETGPSTLCSSQSYPMSTLRHPPHCVHSTRELDQEGEVQPCRQVGQNSAQQQTVIGACASLVICVIRIIKHALTCSVLFFHFVLA